MSVIEVKVGNRNYSLSCEDGEEQHLIKLASEVDAKLMNLAEQMKTGNDSMLMLLTALMTQEELNENKKSLSEKSKNISPEQKDAEITDILNTIAGYLENLVDKVSTSK